MPGEAVARKSRQVHVFGVQGARVAYDAASGAVFRLDEVGQAVLEHILDNPGASPEEVISALGFKYPLDEIREAWDEITAFRGNLLLGRDEALDAPRISPDLTSHPLKALCMNVAHDCNLRCKYCFASCGLYGSARAHMSSEVARRAIDFLIESSGPRKFLDVDFFGGEPLIVFDLVKDAVKYAQARGQALGKEFRFTLTTNCTLLDEAKQAFLNGENINVILSLDGRPEVHDRMRQYPGGAPSFHRAVENALRLVESRSGQGYYVRGTYTRYNLDFHEDVRYLYALGFRHISLEPAIGQGADWAIGPTDIEPIRRSYHELVRFWEECRRRGDPLDYYHFNLGYDFGVCRERRLTGCGGGYEYLAVAPDGTLYPCHQLVGRKEFAMGDVYKGIEKLDVSLSFFSGRADRKDECRSCWARYLCGGGCHANAVEFQGSLTVPHALTCEIVRTRLECGLYIQSIITGSL